MQAFSSAQRRIVSPSTVYLAPKLKFKTTKKLGQLELVHSKVNRVLMYTKMNKMDIQHLRDAAKIMVLTSSSSLLLNLAQMCSTGLCVEEDDEESSSSSDRQKRQ